MGGPWISQKTVEVKMIQILPYISLILLVLWDEFYPEIPKGSPRLRAGASNKDGWGKQAIF